MEEQEKVVKPPVDAETAMKDMTPAQREQLEKLKALYEDKVAKMRFRANLRNRELQKRQAKRDKRAKAEKKSRKANRKK